MSLDVYWILTQCKKYLIEKKHTKKLSLYQNLSALLNISNVNYSFAARSNHFCDRKGWVNKTVIDKKEVLTLIRGQFQARQAELTTFNGRCQILLNPGYQVEIWGNIHSRQIVYKKVLREFASILSPERYKVQVSKRKPDKTKS